MKILFNSLPNIKNSKIYVDFGNGYKSFNLSEVKETGIEIPDDVDTSKIRIKAGCKLINNFNLYDSLFISNVCPELKLDLTKSTIFPNCCYVGDYVIPEGVTSIRSFAFDGCTSLTSIEIPSSVTSIEWSAFYGCTSLTSIEIPSGVTSIGSYAFYKCTSLTSVVIPDGVTSIKPNAFYGCTSLKTINYTGTEEQWNSISKGTDWNKNVPSDCQIVFDYVG